MRTNLTRTQVPFVLHRTRFIVLLLAVSSTVETLPAFADTLQESAMSLEWIVDSADVFFLVRVDAVDKSRRAVKVTMRSRIHKRNSSNRKWRLPPAKKWQLKLIGSRPGDEWLVGVRGMGKDARVFRGINLTRPTNNYRSAAITMQRGAVRVLRSKNQVLTAVKNRIRDNHKLPPHGDRELVDICVSRRLRNHLPASTFIAGYPLPIDCRFWDASDRPPQNQDTHLYYLIVPTSYPRPAAVKKLAIEKNGKKRGDKPFVTASRYMLRGGKVTKVSAKEKTLVGSWKLELPKVTMHLTLHPEGTMLADVRARPGVKLKPLTFHRQPGVGLGAGVWWLEDNGQFLLQMNAMLTGEDGSWSSGLARLYRGHVTSQSESNVTLRDGKMVRVKQAVQTFRYRQAGLWLGHQ